MKSKFRPSSIVPLLSVHLLLRQLLLRACETVDGRKKIQQQHSGYATRERQILLLETERTLIAFNNITLYNPSIALPDKIPCTSIKS